MPALVLGVFLSCFMYSYSNSSIFSSPLGLVVIKPARADVCGQSALNFMNQQKIISWVSTLGCALPTLHDI